MRTSFDVLVIGGGPSGSTVAALLAKAGWNAALIEQSPFPRRKVCGEYISLTNWSLLENLGLGESIQHLAGPEVSHVALLVRDAFVSAELPFARAGPLKSDHSLHCGRALTRDVLDTRLLNHARDSGVAIWQPWKALSVSRDGSKYDCILRARDTGDQTTISSTIIIAAQGSWESSPLQDASRKAASDRDLFGFKAHFRHSSLPHNLMPLLSFPDGYGGMVRCQDGLTSLSCCIRRGRLSLLQRESQKSAPRQAGDHASAEPAGEQVLEHIMRTCPAILPFFKDAVREGAWLSAGPLQPGIRRRYSTNVFAVGNAAGEAHPVVAEGISMALQSAYLLAHLLAPQRGNVHDAKAMDAVGKEYSKEWGRAFGLRIRASSVIAHWAMRPAWVGAALPLFKIWPHLLTLGAEIAGKAALPFQSSSWEKARWI